MGGVFLNKAHQGGTKGKMKSGRMRQFLIHHSSFRIHHFLYVLCVELIFNHTQSADKPLPNTRTVSPISRGSLKRRMAAMPCAPALSASNMFARVMPPMAMSGKGASAWAATRNSLRPRGGP